MGNWAVTLGGVAALWLCVGAGCGEDGPIAGTGGAGAVASTGGAGGEGGEGCNPAACPSDEAGECRVVACIGDACGYTDRAEGTPCELGVCSPVGTCVACNVADDCGESEMCAGGECIADPCANGVVDGDESDVDCGGASCAPCPNDSDCGDAEDCASHFCAGGTCAACGPTDCGDGDYCDAGSCVAQKAGGEICGGGVECQSGHCADGVCCDIACDGECAACDAGGSVGSCTPHADGTDPDKECGADTCNGAGSCRCSDKILDGAETDVDCGGGACSPCPDGKACLVAGDCKNQICDNLVCSGACNNKSLDPGETDVDCGGMSCGPCADGLSCLVAGDCQSGVCNVKCATPTCTDKVKNGNEPATDCGGGCPQKCADNSGCNAASDCQSGVCTLGKCQPPTCSDKVANGQETDTDCGGPSCKACDAGKGCQKPGDCVSNVCSGNVCACSPALGVVDDGSGANGAIGLPDLVLSEIDPGDHIELYNTTGSPITLGAANHWLCSPFNYAKLGNLAPMTVVPAGGYATIPWPAAFNDVNAGGEVILYASPAFADSTQILDFTCWGLNPHASRKSQAELVGKWSGPCNGALSNGAIHRLAGTTGASAASYDTTAAPSPMSCTP